MTIIKKLCRDRRGMAMEMAMMVMVVTFALGALMVTVALMQNNSTTGITKDFEQKLELEQIGENFCAYIASGRTTEFEYDASKYTATVSEDTGEDKSTLTVSKNEDGRVFMTVEVNAKEQTDNGVTTTVHEIVTWEIN